MNQAYSCGVRIGVDIGGTFTDLVVSEPDGTVYVSKVPSTTEEPHRAVIKGIKDILRDRGIVGGEVVEIVHGSTVGSNTILQKTGAATGLITTKGFRDILEIGRIRTPGMFDLSWEKPKPLIARRYRMEVLERMDAKGRIVEPLNEDGLLEAADILVRHGIESIAIVFINSFINPVHEVLAEKLIQEKYRNVAISVSSKILPEIKEYERTSTTVVNAYLMPVMKRYLSSLQSGLIQINVKAPLLVVASNGGVSSAERTRKKPVYSVGSGPAAGVIGAAHLGALQDHRDLIAFDMGGTTAKASLVEDGKVTLTTEYEFRDGISTSSRFIKAGGYMLKAPAIDIAEVGAGGGSIAYVDSGGLLSVGPRSAGADPGPACYGLGGKGPTVTDASVVLGYLNPKHLAGGDLKINRKKAIESIRREVAGPLNMDGIDAAHGIRAIANANMARALRSVSVERGRDPRDLTLMAFGGSGGLHVVELARMLEVRKVLIPLFPGVFTAVGMLASDVEHHLVRPFVSSLDDIDHKDAQKQIMELLDEAKTLLFEEGFKLENHFFSLGADLRYRKQSLELTVPLEGQDLTESALRKLRDDFADAYAARFGYKPEDEAPEFVNLRLIASGTGRDKLDFSKTKIKAPLAGKVDNERKVYFERGQLPINTPIIDWQSIGPELIFGPVIIETYDSTVVVPPDSAVQGGEVGSIVISPFLGDNYAN